jgi:hypothetical protein
LRVSFGVRGGDHLAGETLDLVQTFAQQGTQLIGSPRLAIRWRRGKQLDRFVALRVQVRDGASYLPVGGQRSGDYLRDAVETDGAALEIIAINDPQNFLGRDAPLSSSADRDPFLIMSLSASANNSNRRPRSGGLKPPMAKENPAAKAAALS